MLFLYLLLSILVVLQPSDVVVVVELEEELNEGVVYQLSGACSFGGVFLETSLKEVRKFDRDYCGPLEARSRVILHSVLDFERPVCCWVGMLTCSHLVNHNTK